MVSRRPTGDPILLRADRRRRRQCLHYPGILETGLPVPVGKLPPGTEVCYTGKICEVIYGCFGDFEGFRLSCCGKERLFVTREKGLTELLLRACRERLLITVCTGEQGGDYIRKIIVHC